MGSEPLRGTAASPIERLLEFRTSIMKTHVRQRSFSAFRQANSRRRQPGEKGVAVGAEIVEGKEAGGKTATSRAETGGRLDSQFASLVARTFSRKE